jgi:hypothetical protein
MGITEANIEIIRTNGILSSVSVVIPSWSKNNEDNSITIDMPMFGLKTFAQNEQDMENAIEEAIKCFCIASEKFGMGIEKELIQIGWSFISDDTKNTSLDYQIPSDNFVLEQIMQTGNQYAHADLEFA